MQPKVRARSANLQYIVQSMYKKLAVKNFLRGEGKKQNKTKYKPQKKSFCHAKSFLKYDANFSFLFNHFLVMIYIIINQS